MSGSTRLSAPPYGLYALAALTATLVPTAVWMIFFDTPLERQMGFVQKIFYFHVPAAWVMFLAVLCAAIGSVGYLVKRDDRYDRLADAAVELSILFGAMVLITGPLWGRKAWGAFWVWDVRLTSSLVLVLTLVACKIVRGYAGRESKQIAAGLALFAVVNSVFVYVSVQFWRGTHPEHVVRNKLDPDMKRTLWFCVGVFLVLFVSLLWLRLRQGLLRAEVDRLHMSLAEAGVED